MSPDELALLAAVCADVADDTPRLVYADWLDEQGDPLLAGYAAFIRASVESERFADGLPAHGYVPVETFQQLRRFPSRRELLGKVVMWEGSAYQAGLAWAMRLMGRDCGTGWAKQERWSRGFPATLRLPSVRAWERAVKGGLFRRVPVKRCEVRGREPYTNRLTPHLTGGPIEYLWWTPGAGDRLYGHWELPIHVHNLLRRGKVLVTYPTLEDARSAAWRAFADAGRAICLEKVQVPA